MRNVRGTQVPRLITLAPQGFQPLFCGVWNCGTKNTAYIGACIYMDICSSNIYAQISWKFLKILFHSSTVAP
nr:MAG TPA: hypothetical protein [Caudoviricetes sp.]